MNNKRAICIIGAMECEVLRFKNLIQNIQEINYKQFTFYQGELFNKSIVIAKSGVGKVAGSICTQILADKFNPQLIINTGVAGGLAENMKIGDVAIAEKLVQHDFDATALGYSKGYICNGINPDEPTYFLSDDKLISNASKILEEKLPEITFHKGVIASGDMFVADNNRKKEIKTLFSAIAVEMESAAIAYTAIANDIPFIIIRAISDLADDNLSEKYPLTEENMADLSANITEVLIRDL